jgi:hypothetical protein
VFVLLETVFVLLKTVGYLFDIFLYVDSNYLNVLMPPYNSTIVHIGFLNQDCSY